MSDTPNRFNTHASPPLRDEGAPPEEDLSQAKEKEQLDTDPDEVPSWTEEHGPDARES